MTCREATDFLGDYLEGRLPIAVRVAFDEHLRCCPPCVVFLQTYRVTIELTSATHAPDPCEEDEVPEELIRAILEARAREC